VVMDIVVSCTPMGDSLVGDIIHLTKSPIHPQPMISLTLHVVLTIHVQYTPVAQSLVGVETTPGQWLMINQPIQTINQSWVVQISFVQLKQAEKSYVGV